MPLLVPPQTVGLLRVLAEVCDVWPGKKLEKTTGSVYLDANHFSSDDFTHGSQLQSFPLLFMPDGSNQRMSPHTSLKQNPFLIWEDQNNQLCDDGGQNPANVLGQMMMWGGANILLIEGTTH